MIAPGTSRWCGSHAAFSLVALLAVSAAAAQVGAGPTRMDATGSYQHEVQSCVTGRTQQDRDTCLKEARNAQAERKHGTFSNGNANFQANAMARCNVLAGEERAACLARMQGQGSTSGSVAGGGLLRQVETVVLPEGSGPVVTEHQTSDPVVVLRPADTESHGTYKTQLPGRNTQ